MQHEEIWKMSKEKQKTVSRKATKADDFSSRRIVLVGTYKGDQLTKWLGWYNYPISDDDKIGAEDAAKITELWLFNGKKDQRNYKAEFVGVKTREELIKDYGYPAKGKAHGDQYLLFKTEFKYRHKGDVPEDAERVLIRTADFATAPKVRKQLKAYLESPDRNDPDLAKRLPTILTKLRPEQLRVCEAAVQLELFPRIGEDSGPTASAICQSLKMKVNTPGWPDEFGRRLRAAFYNQGNDSVRTLSLFSGAGGLDIGFSDVGFHIVQSVEIEEKFCETLELNSTIGKRFEGSKVNCVDIRKFSTQGLGRIDFIIGGPPCQTFSAAGRRANGVLGTTDARGVLFREYVRILKELSPRGFLFENVYGLTGAQQGRAWQEIQEAFRAAGYRLFSRILDAADYGVPQHRERLIIVGLKDGEYRFPRPTHGPDSIGETPFYDAGTAVSGVALTEEESRPGLGGRFGHLLPDIPPGLNYSFYTEKLGHPKPIFAWRSKFSDFLYKADPALPVRTIKASGGAYTGPLHWGNRFFALGEYKRLQTFPDDYAISGGKQIAVKQIGNSVPPQLARMLAVSIQQQVFHATLPFKLDLLDASEVLSFRKRKCELTRTFRQKAKAAIAADGRDSQSHLSENAYDCRLSDEFKFEKTPHGAGDWRVVFKPECGISVCDAHDANTEMRDPSMHIRIEPTEAGWGLGLDHMDIAVFSGNNRAFTIGWKAFEQLLVDSSLKADLVQLNGYYQYEPKLRCSCDFNGEFPFKDIVSGIVEGKNVARLASTSQLALSWHVQEKAVWDVAEFLRSLGYEVRNSNTNPQIPADHWLVPYAFPTFTQRSVQLKKKLR